MRALTGFIIIVAAAFASQNSVVRLGERLGLKLPEARQPGPALVVHSLPEDAGCRDLEALREVSAPLVIVSPRASAFRSCAGAPPVVSSADLRGEAPSALLVDAEGTVRLRVTASNVRDLARRAGQDVKDWRAGRDIYDAQCARCHGADGRDVSYSGIKSLAGIGNRHSGAEIIERTLMTGAVDMSAMSEADRRRLALYVAGL